jgi:hypothetical protein
MPAQENKEKAFEAFIASLKENPTSKLVTTPIKNVVENKKSENIQIEVVAMQILLAIKFGDDKVLEKNFELDSKKLKTKFSRTVTKPLIKTILQAIAILEKLKATPQEYVRVLHILKEGFEMLESGKTTTSTKEEVVKEYENPQLKDVLMQFESNQSMVYLLNLANKAYAAELFLKRMNNVLASLEILAAIREDGENKYIEFGKMSLQEFRNTMKGSLSLEVATMCYQAVLALGERTNEVDGVTPSIIEKIKQLKKRFEHITNQLRES